jgi:hypothetical protein
MNNFEPKPFVSVSGMPESLSTWLSNYAANKYGKLGMRSYLITQICKDFKKEHELEIKQ